MRGLLELATRPFVGLVWIIERVLTGLVCVMIYTIKGLFWTIKKVAWRIGLSVFLAATMNRIVNSPHGDCAGYNGCHKCISPLIGAMIAAFMLAATVLVLSGPPPVSRWLSYPMILIVLTNALSVLYEIGRWRLDIDRRNK